LDGFPWLASSVKIEKEFEDVAAVLLHIGAVNPTKLGSGEKPAAPTRVVGNPSVGSLIIYDQPGNNWAGMLDSNVLLYIGVGNWATGRCTLNPDGSSGLCTFSDGLGQLAGFTARVDVTYSPTASNPYLFAWNGTYSFSALPRK